MGLLEELGLVGDGRAPAELASLDARVRALEARGGVALGDAVASTTPAGLLPSGGALAQILAKKSAANFDAQWVNPLTTKLIEEIEARLWFELKAVELKSTNVLETQGEAKFLGTTIFKLLSVKEAGAQVTLVAGPQELALEGEENANSNQQLLVPAKTTSELTGIKALFNVGTILIFNVLVTAERTLIFKHRATSEAHWFNLPELKDLTITAAVSEPKMVVFQRWPKGWQLLLQTG